MARERPGSKRRLAALILGTALLASCGAPAGPSYGWFAPDAVTELAVGGVSPTLRVRVVLPEGYEAARDFAQRLTLRSGDQELTKVLEGLEDPFELQLELARGDEEVDEPTLELLVGFCKAGVWEICYVDRSQISLVRAQADSGTAVEATYRPEPPP